MITLSQIIWSVDYHTTVAILETTIPALFHYHQITATHKADQRHVILIRQCILTYMDFTNMVWLGIRTWRSNNIHSSFGCNELSLLTYNTLRLRQNGRHLPDDMFECIFLIEGIWISIKISLKFVSKGPIKNIPALVQIMAWRRPGDKPLSEQMMVSLLTHICVTRPQWVKRRLN